MQTTYEQRQLAVPWLTRLRWIAVIGQALATVIALHWLDLWPVLPWIALVLITTAATNLLLLRLPARLPTRRIVPGVLVLDVSLFTLLLYLTGGTDNPFYVIYVIHVAMAVIVLGTRWAGIIIAFAAIGYFVVNHWHRAIPELPDEAMAFGKGFALLLTAGLISYFADRVMRELQRNERELVAAREAARETEHLAALTTLAAGAAHELGTPLSTIALVARELERGSEPGDAVEDAALIRREVERCREILNRMRVDVIEDSQHQTSTDKLSNLLTQLRDDLRPSESQRLSIDSREPGETPVTRTRVLRRGIGVLLRNAFDASGPGQNVTLIFSRVGDDMIFEVVDQGSGMSQEVLRRAGEPFFTTKPAGSGMGLGLFLVRLAAKTYRGRFELHSEPGRGTRSILTLPSRS